MIKCEAYENEQHPEEQPTQDAFQNAPENVNDMEYSTDIDISESNQDTSLPCKRKKRTKPLRKTPEMIKKIKENKAADREKDEKISAHMEIICDLCEEQVPNFAGLQTHMRKTHQAKAYAKCCNKKFFNRIMLLQHIEWHTNPEFFKCAVCDKVLVDGKSYRQHMLLKHAAEEEKTYYCDKCPKRFAKNYLLLCHQIVHRERNHICEICQSGFPSTAILNNHRNVKHIGIMCEICAKVLSDRASFDIHMKEHQGIVIPKVQCTVCGSWLRNKHSLQKHVKLHNENGTIHVCNICGKKSPNQVALRSHKRVVHETQRSHVCKICQKSYKKPISLKEHMSVHTGELLYNCPHCPRKFMTSASMYVHRKKAHPTEYKNYQKQKLEANKIKNS